MTFIQFFTIFNTIIMKTFSIFLFIVFTAIISSCRKDVAPKPAPQLNNQTAVTPSASSSDKADIVVKDELTGFIVENACTGESLTATSGYAVINIAPDGSLRMLNVHDFVFTDAAGNAYQGIYVVTFALIGSDGLNNTYKMILNPQGGNNHMVIQGELHISPTSNGSFTGVIDKFFIKCN